MEGEYPIPESAMNEEDFDRLCMQKEGIKVIFLFPKSTESKDTINREVRSILNCALREQLKKNA